MTDEIRNQNQEPHGLFFRMTEIALGVASAASLVMSFIPGINFIGAIVQGGVTLVQTGMDMVTQGFKKAALTFTTGSLLTAVSFIPFMGAMKGMAAAEKGVAGAAKAEGFFSHIAAAFKSAKNTIGTGLNWVGDRTFHKIPGFTTGLTKLRAVDARWTEGFAKHGWVKPVAQFTQHNPIKSGVAHAGAMVAGVGLSVVGDTPPANLLDKNLYTSAPPQPQEGQEDDRKWRNHVAAERSAEKATAVSPA